MPYLRPTRLALEVVAPRPDAPRALDRTELLALLPQPLEGAPRG